MSEFRDEQKAGKEKAAGYLQRPRSFGTTD